MLQFDIGTIINFLILQLLLENNVEELGSQASNIPP